MTMPANPPSPVTTAVTESVQAAGSVAQGATLTHPATTTVAMAPRTTNWVTVAWTVVAIGAVVAAFWAGIHYAGGAASHRSGRRRNPTRGARPSRRARRARHASSTQVQSLLFSRDQGWTTTKASKWAKAHGYRVRDMDVTPHNIRFRQLDPSRFEVLRTTSFGKGIKAIVAR